MLIVSKYARKEKRIKTVRKKSKKIGAIVMACALCCSGLSGVKKADAASMSVSGVMVYGDTSYNSSSKTAVTTTYSPNSSYLLRANIEYNVGNGVQTAGAVDAYGTAVKSKSFSKKPTTLKGRHRINMNGTWSSILYSN